MVLSPVTGRPTLVTSEPISRYSRSNKICLLCGKPTPKEGRGIVHKRCYHDLQKTMVELTCSWCSVRFLRHRYNVEKANRRGHQDFYCCPEHSMAHHAVKNRRKCLRCSEPTSRKTRKYCETCRPIALAERRKLGGATCPHCGEKFQLKSSRRQYCTKECADLAHSRRMRGAGNSHFKAASSYTVLFQKMKKVIRERDKVCRVCLAPTPGRRMPVHHINEMPWDCRPENLILLCAPHHAIHHHSATTPFPWFATYAEEASASMTSRLKATATSLLVEYSSTTAPS